jgi:type I restriction enzyme, R subunit
MAGAGPLESDTCRDYVLPRLKAAGWDIDNQVIEQFPITDGRIIPHGKKHRREKPLRADYVLEYRPGVPVAVVEAKREYTIPGKGLQQAKRYGELLDLPLRYSTNGKGIVEDDRDTGLERDDLTGFPSPDEMWRRYRAWKGIVDDGVAEGLVLPFNRHLRTPDGRVKEPRYYQRVAINRAVEAVLRGDKRMLLTLATGTGKTFVSLQIVWKLWTSEWRTGRKPRVLYLADRNILVDQPIEREYVPAFGEGPIWKLKGEAKAGREIYFGLYQSLIGATEDPDALYRQFGPEFFDLVIVDECHRGSASSDSSWRAILEYFSSAAQIGMTATPKRDDTADTYQYFGEPIHEYSLAQGIDDGFLAPYRVRRVVLSPDAMGFAPDPGQVDLFGNSIPPNLYTTRDFERVVSLLSRTEAAAKHLTEYLKRTDRMAKTIVFCVDSEHADQMRRALHNANSDITKQHPDYVVRIVSDEGDVGRGHLSNLADTEKQFPVIATTSQLLSTGVDLPTVRNVVLFKPIGSMALFKQIIGRGTRLFPDDDKLSFDIIDYAGATALFEDPEFDGPPERVDVDEIDDEGSVVEPPVVEEPEPLFDPGDEAEVDPEDAEDDHPRKFYVRDTQVWVTAEWVRYLDPDTNRLRLVEYREFVADTVRTIFSEIDDLRTRWRKRTTRDEIVEALGAKGIDLDELSERTGLAEADPLDVLVHLAWNQPLATRTDRARRVRREHADFFERYQPEARAVLEELLDKYAKHGVSQLDDLGVLYTPPLDQFGSPIEIAQRFGGSEQLKAAVAALQEQLYAA